LLTLPIIIIIITVSKSFIDDEHLKLPTKLLTLENFLVLVHTVRHTVPYRILQWINNPEGIINKAELRQLLHHS